MFKLIGEIFKYSLLVLTILVLSHIIEIQGVTISNHVLHFMHSVSGYSPQKRAEAIKDDFAKVMASRTKELDKLDAEVSPTDQRALNQVIQNSQGKK